MHPTTWRKELRITLPIALPMMAGQLSQMLVGVSDTVMIGRMGSVPLAAAAFANGIWHVLFLCGLGLTTGVSVFASRAVGAERPRDAGEVLRHSLFIALVYGACIAVLCQSGYQALNFFGQDPAVVRECIGYFVLVGWSTIPILAGFCLKQFSEVFNRTAVPMWASFASVGINIFLNWILIFGNWGSPALGVTGAGIATLLARIFFLVFMIAYISRNKVFAAALRIRWFAVLEIARIRNLIKIGWPASGHFVIEVGCFVFAAVMMGWIGPLQLAAHQIALTCAATTFMIPLGLSMAVTIRVGQCIGANELHRIRAICGGAIGLATALMMGTALIFILARYQIAGLFVQDPATIAISGSLLLAAGVFQISDGLQVLAIGALRGLADVRVPMWLIAVAYWGIAIPLAWTAGFPWGFGAIGIWWALASGLFIAAVLLLIRLHNRLQHLTADQAGAVVGDPIAKQDGKSI